LRPGAASAPFNVPIAVPALAALSCGALLLADLLR